MIKNGVVKEKYSPCDFCGKRADFVLDNGTAICSNCKQKGVFKKESAVYQKKSIIIDHKK